MTYRFENIDDYSSILSRDEQKRGRDILAIIDKWFRDKDDLLFCLLEMVTLNDINAIGETYLYSELSSSQGDLYLEKYKSIVHKVRNKFDFAVSDYLDWYAHKSYILLKNNPDSTIELRRNPNWEQNPRSINSEYDRSIFSFNSNERLSKEKVLEQFNYYASLLFEDLNLKKYPHVCIIIRPISFLEGESIIPLGNLYFHFASASKRESEFYCKLINEFLIVWFKKKGVRIINEIKSQQITAHKSYYPSVSHMDKKAHSKLDKKNLMGSNSIKTYYDQIFEDEQLFSQFKHNLEILKRYCIDLFKELTEHLDSPNSNGRPDFSKIRKELDLQKGINFFKINGVSSLKKKFDRHYFMCILLRREFFKIGLLLFEIEIHILRNLWSNEFNIDHDPYTAETLKAKIWSEHFIPYKHDVSIEEKIDFIEKGLSEFEKDFLNSCRELI